MKLELRADTKPCPHCGCMPVLRDADKSQNYIYGKYRYYMCCPNKGCPIMNVTCVGNTEDEVYAKWNVRFPKEDTDRVVNALNIVHDFQHKIECQANDAAGMRYLAYKLEKLIQGLEVGDSE